MATLLSKKIAGRKGSEIVISLKSIGCGKLLGRGNIKDKMKISVKHASKTAVEKVKKAGGEVIIGE